MMYKNLQMVSMYLPTGLATLVALAIIGSSSAVAAELGKQFDDYTEMHTKTDYGALFFSDDADEHRFIQIDGDGELKLPSQTRYCFVLNHYSKERGFRNIVRTYRAQTTKWHKTAPTTTESFHKPYIPTADEESEAITDYCIEGIQDVVKIAIEFGSNDGSSFRHNISFDLR